MTDLCYITRAADKAARALKDRNGLIQMYHEEGETIRAIAAAAHLSPARIHQIIHEPKEPKDV